MCSLDRSAHSVTRACWRQSTAATTPRPGTARPGTARQRMPHAGGPASDLESSSDARPLQLEGSFLLAGGERGWAIVAERADNDLSSFTGRRRPGFEAMVKAMDEDEAEIVIARPLERLQRNRHDELKLHEVYKTWRAHRLRLLPGGSAVGVCAHVKPFRRTGQRGSSAQSTLVTHRGVRSTQTEKTHLINPARKSFFGEPSPWSPHRGLRRPGSTGAEPAQG